MSIRLGSFYLLVQVGLIIAKLLGYLSIGWLWVLTPLWLPFAFLAGAALIGLTILLVYGAIALAFMFIVWLVCSTLEFISKFTD